jgi:hypothetical protein
MNKKRDELYKKIILFIKKVSKQNKVTLPELMAETFVILGVILIHGSGDKSYKQLLSTIRELANRGPGDDKLTS